MTLVVNQSLKFSSHFGLQVKPESADGTILFLGQGGNRFFGDFLSLSIQNQSLVLSLNLGGPSTRFDHFLTLTLCCLELGEWHKIEAGREGREAYLVLGSQRATGKAILSLEALDVDPVLHLGTD